MNRITKLGSLLLALCLLAALLTCTAFADTVRNDFTVRGNVGTYFAWDWGTPNSEEIISHTEESEYFPDGISVNQSGSYYLTIQGTPTQAGDYWITSHVTTADTNYDVVFYLSITGSAEKSEMSVNESLSATVGTFLSGWTWGTLNGENIGELYVSEGAMPEGLYLPTPSSNCFNITGTPTTAGAGNFTVCVTTFDTVYYVNVSYSISGGFAVTKSPTSEYATEGSNVTFIAAAGDYSYADWVLTLGNTTIGTYRSGTNTTYQNTCTISAYPNNGREYLVIQNVPSSLSGLSIQCRFTNNSKGTINTDTCYMNVEATALSSPTITTQPTGATLDAGKTTLLMVTASDPNNGTLNYQWYSNKTASVIGASAISGATASSYTPPETAGTIYYFCSVTSVKDGRYSAAVTTTPAAVTYGTAAVTPSPSASPAASASPAVSPTAAPAADSSSAKGGHSFLLVLLVILILILAACLVCQILYLRRKQEGKAQPMVKWECPECGTVNGRSSRFCSNCGAARPGKKN